MSEFDDEVEVAKDIINAHGLQFFLNSDVGTEVISEALQQLAYEWQDYSEDEEEHVPVSNEVAEHIINQAVVSKGKVRAVEAEDTISLSVTEEIELNKEDNNGE